VSSAILYFAIVAIWAGVLMPRWLRPGRRRRVEVTEHFEMHTEVYETEADTGTRVDTGTRERSRPAVTEREVMVEEEVTWTRQDAAERRANILKARRRMLGTLVALTVIAFVIALAQVAALWVVVPPAVMLGAFVLLLREAARSDAEQARRGTQTEQMRHRRAEPERQAAPVTAETFERVVSKPAAPDVAEQAEPVVEVAAYSAEIIDISDRVNDQFYDQYTDAANRAVGD
jgi:DNA-binding transcriptional regulator of glucitol operon